MHDTVQDAAGGLRAALAELFEHDELAAAEADWRSLAYEDDALIDSADLRVELPAGHVVHVHVAVNFCGRATWASDEVDLAPVGPRRQLDIADALRLLGETLTSALPPVARGAET